MDEALPIDHQSDVILAWRRAEEHQIAWPRRPLEGPSGGLLLRRDAWDAHANRLMGDQGQATAIERLMRRRATIHIGRTDLREGGRDQIGALWLKPAEIEALAPTLDIARRRCLRAANQSGANQGQDHVQKNP